MSFQTYLLSLRPDDAVAVCVLTAFLAPAALAIAMLAFGRLVAPRSVSPRVGG